MAQENTFPINTQPGIKRDGTQYSGNFYIDGQWCRFMRGVARKMGGYISIYPGLPNIIRDLFVLPEVPNFNIYIADYATLKYFPIDQFGNRLGLVIDRTPVGFLADPNNIWQFGIIFDETTDTNKLIAHAAPNLSAIDNSVNTAIYIGDTSNNNALTDIPNISVSGGIAILHPFLFAFGNNGELFWSDKNNPNDFANGLAGSAVVSSEKVVYGTSTRGGNSSPSGIFLTLGSVIRATYNGNPGTVFTFDTIDTQSSILSSSGIITYNSKIFWAGIDSFKVYNGTVSELPNHMSLLWFYQNLNYQYRQKVWATKVPEFGEIWWWFPYGSSTECNAAVIYNVRENTWYDTRMDLFDSTKCRASGYFEQVFADPIWADTEGNIWIHEIGNNKVDANGAISAIYSSFETGDISNAAQGPLGNWVGIDKQIFLDRVEPDFWQQAGDINMYVAGRSYANSTNIVSGPYILTPDTEFQSIREQRRFMTLKFVSNSIDGFYELGQFLCKFGPGDGRP